MSDPITIAPVGDLDVATVPAFEASLAETARAGDGGMIVDLSSVDFIDSSGLAVLVGLNEQLRRDHRSLAVVAPRGTAAAVLLTLTGVRRTLTVFESRRDAITRGVVAPSLLAEPDKRPSKTDP